MRALAAFACLLLVAACQAPPPPEPEFTDADRQAIATELERLNGEFLKLNRPEDTDASFAMWSPVADSYFVTEPALFAQSFRIIAGMQDLREFFDPSNWNRQSTNITALSTSVAVLSPESAVHVTAGHYSITNMEGETGPEYPMSMTGVWVKEDGGWKLVHWHQSWSTTPIESGTEG
jgi:ketosteroid isomerase-like protein